MTARRGGIGYAYTHKGYMLVEVGHNYFCACKGSERVPVGSMRHGDHAELMRRFRKKVDELKEDQWA